jgi:hypothetical protein
MTRLLIGILAITGAVGCLPNIKPIRLDQNTVSSLKVKDLAVTKRVRPPFGAVTRGAAAIGVVPLVGLFTSPLLHAASTGESMIRSANLADPAIEIADGIAAALEKKYGIRRAGIIDIVDPPLEDDYLVLAKRQEFSLVLDVASLGWGIAYPAVFADEYSFQYWARLRLVLPEARALLAEGECRGSKSPRGLYPYEKLLENGAAKLKEEIQIVVQYCIKEFSEQYLGM